MGVVIIRRTKFEDMTAIMDAHRRSIIELCSKDYNQEQINCWSSVNYNGKLWSQAITHDYHISIEKHGKIEGFCHACIKDETVGEIRALFFTKEIVGQGYGRKAIGKALNYLRTKECSKVNVTGTITAKPFYEKMGFTCMQKISAETRGTNLICYNMTKET